MCTVLLQAIVSALVSATLPMQQQPAPTPGGAATAMARPAAASKTLGTVLSRSDLVAEGTVTSVTSLGHGIEVVRFEASRIIKSDEGEEAPVAAVVLAAPGDFTKDQTYLLFLDRFRNGDRFTWIDRLAPSDRDYAAKLKVLEQFVHIASIQDLNERTLEMRDVLLRNLADRDLFVKWNAVRELKEFAEQHPSLFGDRERAAMVRVYNNEPSPTFRTALLEILETVGVSLKESGS